MRCSKCGSDNREGRKFCRPVRPGAEAGVSFMWCTERAPQRSSVVTAVLRLSPRRNPAPFNRLRQQQRRIRLSASRL